MDVNKLKIRMKNSNISPKELASALGMSESTFKRKLKNNGFGLLDANIMIKLLHIENPEDIFFNS